MAFSLVTALNPSYIYIYIYTYIYIYIYTYTIYVNMYLLCLAMALILFYLNAIMISNIISNNTSDAIATKFEGQSSLHSYVISNIQLLIDLSQMEGMRSD